MRIGREIGAQTRAAPFFSRFCLMRAAKSAIMTKWLNVFENQRRESDWQSWRRMTRRWIIPTRRAFSPRRSASKMPRSAACGCWFPQTACRARACRRWKGMRRRQASAWRSQTARWSAFPKKKIALRRWFIKRRRESLTRTARTSCSTTPATAAIWARSCARRSALASRTSRSSARRSIRTIPAWCARRWARHFRSMCATSIPSINTARSIRCAGFSRSC